MVQLICDGHLNSVAPKRTLGWRQKKDLGCENSNHDENVFQVQQHFFLLKEFSTKTFLHSLKRRRSFDSIKTFLRLRRPSRNKINLFKSAVIKFGKKMKNKLKLLKWFIELSCNLCKITRLLLLHCDSFSLSRSLVRDAIDQLRYPQFSKTVGNQSRETISIRGNFTSDPGWEEAAETNLAEKRKNLKELLNNY